MNVAKNSKNVAIMHKKGWRIVFADYSPLYLHT
jgi:hypothetical protein